VHQVSFHYKDYQDAQSAKHKKNFGVTAPLTLNIAALALVKELAVVF
jgi:hypothetical protein